MSELEVENKTLREKIETLEQRVKELEEKNASYVDRQNKARVLNVQRCKRTRLKRLFAYGLKD